MKRILTLTAALIFLLCSCSKTEPQKIITSDMLNITNTEKSFFGCRDRYNAVISAMKSKVTVLEAEHNRLIKNSGNSEYFLEKDYILTAFEPFVMQLFYITESFTPELDSEEAKTVFENEAAGADIIYETDGKSSFVLKFVAEEMVKEFSVEYSKESDSFRYICQTEDNESDETIVEFLEFTTAKDGTYVIQSSNTRCSISFDEDGHIISFCCGQLSDEIFTQDESVFENRPETSSKHWVLSRGKLKFSNIHTFEDEILTHEDCSSGPWKSIEIEAKNFESAFYM